MLLSVIHWRSWTGFRVKILFIFLVFYKLNGWKFSLTTYFILLSNCPDYFICGSERDDTFILLKIKYHTSDGSVDQRGRSMRNKQNILSQMKIYNASYLNFVCTKRHKWEGNLWPQMLYIQNAKEDIPDSTKGPSKRRGKP